MQQSNEQGSALVEFIAFALVAFGLISAFATSVESRFTRDVRASYLATAAARAVTLERFDEFKLAMNQYFPESFASRTIEKNMLTVSVTVFDATESARQPL